MNDLEFYELDSIGEHFDCNDNKNFLYGNEAQDFDEENLVNDPLEYRKARKRRQNRESAARARARKKINITQVSDEIKILEDLSEKLSIENAKLKAENEMLKKELDFYKSMIIQ
jgi:bZIP transcription factor